MKNIQFKLSQKRIPFLIQDRNENPEQYKIDELFKV